MNKVIFHKVYDGFESLSDLQRDLVECMDPDYNSHVNDIPGEFQGKMTVTITYSEEEQDHAV